MHPNPTSKPILSKPKSPVCFKSCDALPQVNSWKSLEPMNSPRTSPPHGTAHRFLSPAARSTPPCYWPVPNPLFEFRKPPGGGDPSAAPARGWLRPGKQSRPTRRGSSPACPGPRHLLDGFSHTILGSGFGRVVGIPNATVCSSCAMHQASQLTAEPSPVFRYVCMSVNGFPDDVASHGGCDRGPGAQRVRPRSPRKWSCQPMARGSGPGLSLKVNPPAGLRTESTPLE